MNNHNDNLTADEVSELEAIEYRQRYERSLHEAWARGQVASRGEAAWGDPAVKRILAAYEVRNAPEGGYGSYEDLKRDFLAGVGGGSDGRPGA